MRIVHRRKTALWLSIAIGLGTASGGTGAAETGVPDTLERALVRQAHRLIPMLKARGYGNVGVLKFRVAGAKGVGAAKGTFDDRLGEINATLASRLELALLLVNDPKQPVGIIHDASAAAAKIAGADYLTPEGRRRFFAPGASYALAWQSARVDPDAFLTGVAVVSADGRTFTIDILVFDRARNALEPLGGTFQAPSRPAQLGEIGVGFTRAYTSDDGAFVADPAWKPGAPAINPLRDKRFPITLEIDYRNPPGRKPEVESVPIEDREGIVTIREPRADQRVEFVLKNTSSAQRFAVVLKVNGENTLDRQRLPDDACWRWVLKPGRPALTIRGYQMANGTTQVFQVVEGASARRAEAFFGPDTGKISLTVFAEARGAPLPIDISDDGAEIEAIRRGTLPISPPANYNALKAQLIENANLPRGVIDGGGSIASATRQVSFETDPEPVASVTITYLRTTPRGR